LKKISAGLALTLVSIMAIMAGAQELFKYETVKSQAVGGIIDDIALGQDRNEANIYALFHNTSSDYQIKVFSKDLTPRFSFGKSDLNAGLDKYFEPYNIAVDSDENIYVLGWKQDIFGCSSIIKKFNKNGMLLLEWGEPATRRPEKSASKIAVSRGNVYLANPALGSIFKYGSAGRIIKKYRDKTLLPTMVAGSFQHIFVVDQPVSVKKYDFDFNLIDEYEFKCPATDIFCDASGFYLASVGMIYKYSFKGILLEKYSLPLRTAGCAIAVLDPDSSLKFIISDGTRLNEIKRAATSEIK
jgi:hypothetical protein